MLAKWDRKPIGELCDFGNGYGFKASDWSERGLPIIRIQNLNGVREFNYFDGPPPREQIVVNPGELLFAWAGVKGVSFGPKIWNGPKGLLNQHIYKITPRKGVDPFWLYSTLRVITSKIEASDHGFKSSLLHVKKADIADQVVPVPALDEQQAISQALSTWDHAIEKTEALIKAKERRKVGLMQRLLTGKVRFGELGPVADEAPPTDWDTCRLEDICKRVTRKNPDGITHVLTASGEHGLVDQRDYFNRSVAGESLANYYLLKKGEFAYNRSSMNGYPYGAIKRLDRYEAGLLSTLYLCFRITSEKVDSDYLRHFFDSPILNKELRGIVQVGARAHGLLNVSTGDFMRLRVCMPSLKEQKRIATCLNAATAEIKGHRNQLAALKEQKKSLMQQLLTGKVRVKEV